MYLKWAAETILTSFLFLSPVWSRPSDIVCNGGRGEGDKWFDGCRWCVCQQSGPLCSSSECSQLVSLVSPCQKVDSRWWDGCYHCKCYPHGIECTADDTCIMLLRSERFNADFLSHDTCVNPKDDRCICGIDGVPSCTAEVIDRNAYPATTIGLNPAFPASASLVSPKVVYYDRSFRNPNKGGAMNHRPEYYSDSSYTHHERGRKKHPNEQYNKRHSLVKRHTYKYRRHSQDFHNSNHHRPDISKYKRTVNTHNSASHNRSNSREHFQRNSAGKGHRERQQIHNLDTASAGDSSPTTDRGQFYPKNKWRDGSQFNNYNSPYDMPSEQTDVELVPDKTWPIPLKKEIREKHRLQRLYEDTPFSENSEVQEEQTSDEKNTLDEMYFNDQPFSGTTDNVSPSLLIASGNRCRWGVRWYGGSLRCYCGFDNSITCGDPSFVASRIDGFRLERASCEEGHIWEDDDSCRECKCQISGVVLCRRSPSCPLPFLIKPLPMDPDDDSHFDRRDFDITRKGHSGGHTDEFTGQDEHKIDWGAKSRSDEKDYNENDGDDDVNIDESVSSDKDSIDKNTTTKDEKLNLSLKDKDEEEEMPIGSAKDDRPVDLDLRGDAVDLQVDSTSLPVLVLETDDEKPNYENIDVSSEKDSSDKDSSDNSNDMSDKENENIEKSDFKRITQVILGECKPKSRWLDGCKRCECDQEGRKHCDDSRCPKPVAISREMTNISSDIGDRRRTRPMQRPPDALLLGRNRPVNLDPPFLLPNPCGRFTVGQKYWDECNICVCTSDGPKCTAKNCA